MKESLRPKKQKSFALIKPTAHFSAGWAPQSPSDTTAALGAMPNRESPAAKITPTKLLYCSTLLRTKPYLLILDGNSQRCATIPKTAHVSDASPAQNQQKSVQAARGTWAVPLKTATTCCRAS